MQLIIYLGLPNTVQSQAFICKEVHIVLLHRFY